MGNITGRQKCYALLSLIGLVLTWYFNIQFMRQSEGLFDLSAFMQGAFANPASSSLSTDLTIAVIAFVIWMVSEAKRLEMKNWWVYIALTFGVAFAFAFPVFLYVREGKLNEIAD